MFLLKGLFKAFRGLLKGEVEYCVKIIWDYEMRGNDNMVEAGLVSGGFLENTQLDSGESQV